MPETKPFIAYPIWSNSKHGRQFWGRRQYYYKDMKNKFGCFTAFWKYLLQHRSSIRVLKCFIVFALLLTCVFNIKLAAKAKLKYERYKDMFLDSTAADSNFRDFDHPNFQRSDKINIEVLSSQNEVEVVVNRETVLHDNSDETGRGLHVVVLNQFSGAVTAIRLFDIYTEGEDRHLLDFLDSIRDENRLLVFAVKDEASFHLESDARQRLRRFGSSKVGALQWRGMWAAVMTKRGELHCEDLTDAKDTASWGSPVKISCSVVPRQPTYFQNCHWPSTSTNARREHFCARYDGYEELCSCGSEFNLEHKMTNFTPNHVQNIPVVVIASNRPQYLYRMLKSVLAASGVNPDKITVFIDGYFEEPMELTKLFGVKGIFHMPVGIKNARISQNYKASLSATFSMNPDAQYTIVLEEDLDVSPDFFSFFSQTLYVMEKDSSIFCISAWNDQGYEHSCLNPAKLYRVETFPGLGWLLSRKLFEEELEPNWPGPDKPWDWDMWMRSPTVRKNRECVIPDVSRTFHFGTVGINMNSYFHRLYFDKHKLNLLANVKLKDTDSLTKDKYEKAMHLLVRESEEVNHLRSPCESNFIEEQNPADSFVAYIEMEKDQILEEFKKLFKCLKIWDLDVRGIHKHSFRTYIDGKHVIFIAYPISPYSIYKSVDIQPIKLNTET